MEKLFRSADRILSEIGRITLGRPLLASILLISVITITVCANELWHTSSPSVVAVAEEPNATSPVATAQQAAPTPLLATSPVSVQSTTPVLTAVKSTAPLAISPIPPASIAKPQSKTTRAAQKKDVGPKAQPAGAITSAGMTYVSGRIIRSLAVDAKKAGLSVKQVNQLVQIFNQKKIGAKYEIG